MNAVAINTITNNNNIAANDTVCVVDFEEYATVMEGATAILERHDLGNVLILKVMHATRGILIMINTIGEKHALVQL